MLSAGAGTSRIRIVAGIICILILSLSALTGCKDEENKETGDHASPVSVLSAPSEVTPQEEMATLPSADMKGLSVETIPDKSLAIPLPEMIPVSGMDMSVRMSQRMMSTPGWTQQFPALFKPVSDCLSQIDGGAAYAAGVTPESDQVVLVHVMGLDGRAHDCRINGAGGQALSIKDSEQEKISGPAFYPRSAGRPVTDNPPCQLMEAVVARPGGLIGWLAFPQADCNMPPAP